MSLLQFIRRSHQFEARLAENRCRLGRLALSWCHNRALAEDLVQDTLTKALARHDQLRDPAAMHAWLCSILANCWHDHLRGLKPTETIEDIDDALLAAPGCPEDDCLQNEVVRRVRQAVAKLPVAQREVVTLVDLEEFSYASVATILGIPIGTVMSRLSRARAALRETLREPARVTAEVRPLRSMR